MFGYEHAEMIVSCSIFLNLSDLDLTQKRVLIREDFNVPMHEGVIRNAERITRALPTIEMALKAHARILLLSHWGRPNEGEWDPAFSLAPVAQVLSQELHQPVRLLKNWLNGADVAPGQVVLCENVRFQTGEKNNDPTLAKRMAALCDIFVMDAFATAHRAEASTVGVAEYAPIACAGPLFCSEITALSRALEHPQRPLIAILGGSKVSTKIHLLEALLEKVDQLIVGGVIANTFLKAKGYPIGQSLHESDWVTKAAAFFNKAAKKGVTIFLPQDVVVAKQLAPTAETHIKRVEEVSETDAIFDIGPQTAAQWPAQMAQARTIVWNGPVGAFEIESFSHGTRALALAIAASSAYSIAGGGDTLAALDQFGIAKQISYISTGGGAFLEFLEGRPLPAMVILEKRAQQLG